MCAHGAPIAHVRTAHGAGAASHGTNLGAMLAAEIWHWWIGIVLLGVSVLACVALVGGYLKSVTAARYPSKRQRAEAERAPDRNPV